MRQTTLSRLPELLLPWYQENRRQLPWRADREPYHIWVSEIMLQQTRVEAVRGYYARFLAALPDLQSLAQCDDDTLQKLWEGLGYYSRVRNLKKAAVMIITRYDGKFPKEYNAIRSLPGIGDYTAGAICSISYDLPTPAVDGNVLRVYARLMDDCSPIDRPEMKRRVQQQLSEIYPKEAGAFTQALMELGATLCGPNRKPDCDQCPCREICAGYSQDTAETLPVKTPKQKKRLEEKTVFIFSCDGKYALEKRPDQGLLASLWQFPNVPGKLETEAALTKAEALGVAPRELLRQVERNHIFTHIKWELRGIYLEVSEPSGDYRWLTAEEIESQAALPTAFRQFWEEIDHV